MSSKKAFDVLSKLFKGYQGNESFQRVAAACRVVTAEPTGKVRVEFDVAKEMTNPFGTLHGGYTATLIDIVTTTALIAAERPPGVSVDLHISYLSAAKIGETVVMDAEVIRAGQSTAFTKASLFIKGTDKLIATGLHTKALPRVKSEKK
ncbi:unnamed protein product, partial [Mesorhabditis belari]|uniref:Acyl-coenzyme A thioesterase 13 n=1 Tax=Mesorhabditis belari TaxID=2138241 RepID=A0AAF3FK56_9BILA